MRQTKPAKVRRVAGTGVSDGCGAVPHPAFPISLSGLFPPISPAVRTSTTTGKTSTTIEISVVVLVKTGTTLVSTPRSESKKAGPDASEPARDESWKHGGLSDAHSFTLVDVYTRFRRTALEYATTEVVVTLVGDFRRRHAFDTRRSEESGPAEGVGVAARVAFGEGHVGLAVHGVAGQREAVGQADARRSDTLALGPSCLRRCPPCLRRAPVR